MKFTDAFRAYQLTISPKGDISDVVVRRVRKWLSKTCLYVYAVIEGTSTGKRHLHAAMYFEDTKNKKQLQEYVWKIVKVEHKDSIGKFAVKVQVMPGSNWVDEYLRKEKDVEVVINVLPEERDELLGFYPSAEDQEALIQATSQPFQGDRFLDLHEGEYKRYLERESVVSTIGTATEYFLWRVNVDRTLPRLRDSRTYVNMGLALHRYISMDKSLTSEEESLIRRVTESYDFSGR